jgi:hypothetical protein
MSTPTVLTKWYHTRKTWTSENGKLKIDGILTSDIFPLLSVRTANNLLSHDINTVGKLVDVYCAGQLSEIRGFGLGAYIEVYNWLNKSHGKPSCASVDSVMFVMPKGETEDAGQI